MKKLVTMFLIVLIVSCSAFAQICIDVDTAVQLYVNKHPIQTSDGTLDKSVTYNEAGMELFFHFTPCNGSPTTTEITPTTGGDYDWTHLGGAVYIIEIPASGGASVNNDTEGTGFFTGNCTATLSWSSHDYVFRHANKNDLEIEDGTAGTNQDADYDGTGYAGGTIEREVDVTDWNGSTNGIANWIIVFSTDFATNYDTTADMWNVDLTAIGGSTQSATDLKDFADSGYDPVNHGTNVYTIRSATPAAGDGSDFDSIPWNASWDAEVESEVDDSIGAGTGTALTGIPWNASWDAEVESEVDDSIGGGNGTSLTAIPWNASWDAEVQSEVKDQLDAYFFQYLFYAAYDPASKPGNASGYLNVLVESDSGVPRFTTNSLENAPSGTASYILNTTIASVTTKSTVTLTDGVTSDWAYYNHTLEITDADTGKTEARRIKFYSNEKVVIVDMPYSFTPAAGDIAIIPRGSYVVPNAFNEG